MLDLEAVTAENLGDPGRRLDLLERRLGVRVDPMRQAQDLVARGINFGRDPSLRLGMRRGRREGRSGPLGAERLVEGDDGTRPPARTDGSASDGLSARRTGLPRR